MATLPALGSVPATKQPAAPRPASGGLATENAPPLDIPFRFMAIVVGALALMALVYPLHLPLLLGSFYDSHLTTFVHVNTLGVIGAAILGASYQLLPVVLQAPLASVRLARLSWWLYLPGLLLFVAGLSQGWLIPLATAGTLLFSAIALYLWIVARTLAQAAERDVVAWHVAAAAIGLAAAASLGLLLALSKFTGFLGGSTLPVLATHVSLMLGAWVAPMLMGVAYRLVGMFTLSEDRLRQDWAWAALALTVGGGWTLGAVMLLGSAWLGSLGWPLRLIASAALLGGQALFAAQLLRLYHGRRRRTFDVHVPFALTSTGFGVLAALLVFSGTVAQVRASEPLWVAAGWWAIAGWAQTAIQGFFFKIATFLTWLHRYAPLVGRRRVPKLDELYSRRLAIAGWAAWTAGVALAGAAALLQVEWLIWAADAGMCAGAAAFVANAVRIGSHWRRR